MADVYRHSTLGAGRRLKLRSRQAEFSHNGKQAEGQARQSTVSTGNWLKVRAGSRQRKWSRNKLGLNLENTICSTPSQEQKTSIVQAKGTC